MSKVGVNYSHAAEFSTKFGEPIAWNRVFAQTQAWSTNNPWKYAIDASKRGERPVLSFKLATSMSSAGTGSEDARVKAIANGLVAAGVKDGIICIEHEPENPSKNIIPAQWVAMNERLLPMMKAILGPGWRTSICLMGWTADPASGRNEDVYRVNAADIIGWDPYNTRGAVDGTNPYANPNNADKSPEVLFGTCLEVADRWGKPSTIFEVACAREQTSYTKRTAWWKVVADKKSLERFEFVCHFDMGIPDGKAEWAIRDEPETLAEFKRALGTTIDPCAALEAEVAALNAQVASLSMDKTALESANALLRLKINDAVGVLTA